MDTAENMDDQNVVLDPILDPEEEEETDKMPESYTVAISDPLHRYLAEVRKYPFLTPEEEKRLTLKYMEEGDLHAVTQLVLSHLRLVVSIAMRYKHLPFPIMDIIQEGNIGLMHGIKKFDPYRNVRVAPYVTWWIRASILKYIIENWSLIRIGTNDTERKLFFQLSKERERLQRLGYEATNRLLATRLNVKESDVADMKHRISVRDLSLDMPHHTDSDEPLEQTLPSHEEAVDERLAREQLQTIFQEKLQAFSLTIKPREADILTNRILSNNPTTLETFAQKYKISKERVRQLEGNLIKKLKKFMREEIRDFDDMASLY